MKKRLSKRKNKHSLKWSSRIILVVQRKDARITIESAWALVRRRPVPLEAD